MNGKSRILKINFVIVFLLLSFFIAHSNVEAKPQISANDIDINDLGLSGGGRYFVQIDIIKATNKTSIKKLKSSNGKILDATWKKDEKIILSRVFKIGKATITGVLYEGKKKVKKFTIHVTVHKYKNPVRIFKLGNINYASKYNKSDTVIDNRKFLKKKKLKVYIKPKKGWKLQCIYLANRKNHIQIRRLSNGSTFTRKKAAYMGVILYNRKSKHPEHLLFY